MKITKSSRHSKITGDFGEALILYWLSKHGFECGRFDHIGIDLIARRSGSRKVMGISVKSRCRVESKEDEYLRIPKADLEKAALVCAQFHWIPYYAIVIDAGNLLRAYIMSKQHLVRVCPPTPSGIAWKMTPAHVSQYDKDPHIMTFEFQSQTKKWWR
ncbi:MAG: hypothetical protein ACKODH_09955 [Limisphaerales bacterium]